MYQRDIDLTEQLPHSVTITTTELTSNVLANLSSGYVTTIDPYYNPMPQVHTPSYPGINAIPQSPGFNPNPLSQQVPVIPSYNPYTEKKTITISSPLESLLDELFTTQEKVEYLSSLGYLIEFNSTLWQGSIDNAIARRDGVSYHNVGVLFFSEMKNKMKKLLLEKPTLKMRLGNFNNQNESKEDENK